MTLLSANSLSSVQQATGIGRWLGWSAGTPGGTPGASGGRAHTGAGAAYPTLAASAEPAVALQLLQAGAAAGMRLLVLSADRLECWQARCPHTCLAGWCVS